MTDPERIYWLYLDNGELQYNVAPDQIVAENQGWSTAWPNLGFIWADAEDRKIYFLPPDDVLMGRVTQTQWNAWLETYQDQLNGLMAEVECIELE